MKMEVKLMGGKEGGEVDRRICGEEGGEVD